MPHREELAAIAASERQMPAVGLACGIAASAVRTLPVGRGRPTEIFEPLLGSSIVREHVVQIDEADAGSVGFAACVCRIGSPFNPIQRELHG